MLLYRRVLSAMIKNVFGLHALVLGHLGGLASPTEAGGRRRQTIYVTRPPGSCLFKGDRDTPSPCNRIIKQARDHFARSKP